MWNVFQLHLGLDVAFAADAAELVVSWFLPFVLSLSCFLIKQLLANLPCEGSVHNHRAFGNQRFSFVVVEG